MKTPFHASLAAKANHDAATLVEPMAGLTMNAETATILVRNMSVDFSWRTMAIADALVRDLDPQAKILPGFSYDEVMTEAGTEDLSRSARRAAAAVPEGTVVEGEHEKALLEAVKAELTYLWLRSCEKLYDTIAAKKAA